MRSRRRAFRRGSSRTSGPFSPSVVSGCRRQTVAGRGGKVQPALFSRVVVYMRRLFIVLILACASALAQTPPPRNRPPVPGFRPGPAVQTAEMAVKQAMEQLANVRKGIERDVEVLNHLRTADD